MLNLLVAYPHLAALMKFFANIFGGYGSSIIIITVIIRLLLTPLTLTANKERITQQERFALLQPRVRQKIHAKSRVTSIKKKQKYNAKIIDLYKRNHVHLLWRPYVIANAIIQWPILIALYLAFRFTPAVNSTMFSWGPLGKLPLGAPNWLLFGAVVIFYFAEAFAMLYSIPKAQRNNIRFYIFIPAAIIGMFTFVSPAGVQLYFIISGLSGCLIDWYSTKQRSKYRNQARKALK